mgnify:CR=1 FL=1
MEKKIIYRMSSPYRDEFRITGYEFGDGEKTVAIIGAMRGDEIQQQYVCAQIVKRLIKIEKDGRIDKGCKILVIPNANPFSMNLEKRFWSMDNTDINRMFPGYDKGETTQRIAAALFDTLKNFRRKLAEGAAPADLLDHMCREILEKVEADKESGRIDRKTEHLQKEIAKTLGSYVQLVKAEGIVEANAAFDRVRVEFVKSTEKREQRIAAVSENLECAFDFMERAFGESQEMVVFITELTVNFYAAKFLSENESGRFYKYNKGLLANERRASILGGIEEVEMLMNGN